MSTLPPVNPIFSSLGVSIFEHMSGLSARHKALNFGQGTPDEDGPLAIREVAARAVIDGPHQYPPSRGLPALREAVSGYTRAWYGLDYDPETEVCVTSGGTEALGACIMGLVPRGGEIVLIQPAYDCYRPIAEAVGAVVKTITLKAPGFRLTEEDLRKAVTPNTRAIVINSPLNPVGRVFDREELEALARVVRDTQVNVICDEVYEHLVYGDSRHVPLATLPGMRERCVRVGSAGKMFSLTSWKVGWVTGPKALIDTVFRAHQFITFTTPSALQAGAAFGLKEQLHFSTDLARTLGEKRLILSRGIEKLGFKPFACEGTYFLTADISGVTNEPDQVFCERLVKEAGVALIPLSAFFSGDKPVNLVRFSFCKKIPVIEDMLARLGKHFGGRA